MLSREKLLYDCTFNQHTMVKRREALRVIGASGIAVVSGCTGFGSEYPQGEAEIRHKESNFERGVRENIRRMNRFRIEAPENTWGQLHVNLTENAVAAVVTVAQSGGGKIMIIKRDEWLNYIDEDSDFDGPAFIPMGVSVDGPDQLSQTFDRFNDHIYSVAVENYESGGEFKAKLAFAEEMRSRTFKPERDVVESPDKVYDQLNY